MPGVNVWATPTTAVPELRWPFVRLSTTGGGEELHARIDDVDYTQVAKASETPTLIATLVRVFAKERLTGVYDDDAFAQSDVDINLLAYKRVTRTTIELTFQVAWLEARAHDRQRDFVVVFRAQ
jgi:hypothetical protein